MNFLFICRCSACSPDRSITSENIHSSYSEGQEVDIRIMEVNTANNKMSLSMLPATEEAGEFLFVSGGRWLIGMKCLCLAIFSCCCMQEAATYEVCVFFAYSMHDENRQHRLLCSPVFAFCLSGSHRRNQDPE